MTQYKYLSDEYLETQAKKILVMGADLAERVIKQLIYELVESEVLRYSVEDGEYYFDTCGVRLSEC